MSSIAQHVKTQELSDGRSVELFLVWDKHTQPLWRPVVVRSEDEEELFAGELTTKKKARRNGLAWLRRNT